MAANDWGIRLWDDAGTLLFDTTDYSGRYVDSLSFTGPAQGTFTVTGRPADSGLWIKVEYYNVTPDQFSRAIVVISGSDQIEYNLINLSAGCLTIIHYGWR